MSLRSAMRAGSLSLPPSMMAAIPRDHRASGLQALLAEVDAGKIDIVVVYKVDRLTRSLADFAKIVEALRCQGRVVRFVSPRFQHDDQQGRLTSMCCSPSPSSNARSAPSAHATRSRRPRRRPLDGRPRAAGLPVENRKLLIHDEEAERVRLIYRLYLETGSLPALLWNSGHAASVPRFGTRPMAAFQATAHSRRAVWLTCYATASTSENCRTRAPIIRASMQPCWKRRCSSLCRIG